MLLTIAQKFSDFNLSSPFPHFFLKKQRNIRIGGNVLTQITAARISVEFKITSNTSWKKKPTTPMHKHTTIRNICDCNYFFQEDTQLCEASNKHPQQPSDWHIRSRSPAWYRVAGSAASWLFPLHRWEVQLMRNAIKSTSSQTKKPSFQWWLALLPFLPSKNYDWLSKNEIFT